MNSFFDKTSSKRCRICAPSKCHKKWVCPRIRSIADLCPDHDSLAGYGQVLLNTWTTALHLDQYRGKVVEQQAAWLVEMALELQTPPATLEGLLTAAFLRQSPLAIMHIAKAVKSFEKGRLWVTPTIAKRLCDSIMICTRNCKFNVATELIETVFQHIPCSGSMRQQILFGALSCTRHSGSDKVLKILQAALKDYPDAPLANWHGLSLEQLKKLREWLSQIMVAPNVDTLENFIFKMKPAWQQCEPFDIPSEWDIAWGSGTDWKTTVKGIISICAETSVKPSMVLKFLFDQNFFSCYYENVESTRRFLQPARMSTTLSYKPPFVGLFERMDELGADEVCFAARLLHAKLPQGRYPGFQEMEKSEVERIISNYFSQLSPLVQHRLFTVGGSYIHNNEPWVTLSSKPRRYKSMPIANVLPEKMNGCVWLSSPGSISENPRATKIALRKPSTLAAAHTVVDTLKAILPVPRVGWTENLFELAPSPACAVALMQSGKRMDSITCEWKSGAMPNEKKEANAILGILYAAAGADVVAQSPLGNHITRFISDMLGNFTEEDLWVNEMAGSLKMLCNHLYREIVANWHSSAQTMPLLCLVALVVATFHSKHPGSFADGLRAAQNIEEALATNVEHFPHVQRWLHDKPELEKPTLWFTPFRPSNFKWYPKHIRSSIFAFLLTLNRLHRSGRCPFLPPEIALTILRIAGHECVAIGKAPALVFENDGFFDAPIFDTVFQKSRGARHGMMHSSTWNMF